MEAEAAETEAEAQADEADAEASPRRAFKTALTEAT